KGRPFSFRRQMDTNSPERDRAIRVGQRPMSTEARRSGLEALRAVLRRRNPGFDVVFKLEADDLVHDSPFREVDRSLPTPEDARSPLDGVHVAATAAGRPDHDRV